MSFGFSGCHGSGKTTLARDLANILGLTLYETRTSEIAKSLGFNAVADLDPEDRMNLQELLLENFWEVTQKLPRPFISDRTPVDMLAYALGEMGGMNSDPQLGERLERYVECAIWVTQNTFLSVLITRPLPYYEVDSHRPPQNVGYQRKFQLLVEGAAFNLSRINRFVLPMNDHRERMAAAATHIGEQVEESMRVKPVIH